MVADLCGEVIRLREVSRELAGAVETLLEQISQMRGMFPGDVEIECAVKSADAALDAYREGSDEA